MAVGNVTNSATKTRLSDKSEQREEFNSCCGDRGQQLALLRQCQEAGLTANQIIPQLLKVDPKNR